MLVLQSGIPEDIVQLVEVVTLINLSGIIGESVVRLVLLLILNTIVIEIVVKPVLLLSLSGTAFGGDVRLALQGIVIVPDVIGVTVVVGSIIGVIGIILILVIAFVIV